MDELKERTQLLKSKYDSIAFEKRELLKDFNDAREEKEKSEEERKKAESKVKSFMNTKFSVDPFTLNKALEIMNTSFFKVNLIICEMLRVIL